MEHHFFIPSWKRSDRLHTIHTLQKLGVPSHCIHVVIDDEDPAGVESYRKTCAKKGLVLDVFDFEKEKSSYKFIFPGKRTAAIARNCIWKMAEKHGLDHYFVMDDDVLLVSVYAASGRLYKFYDAKIFNTVLDMMYEFMKRRHIGIFGFSQSGDFFSYIEYVRKLYRKKTMNFLCYLTKYSRGTEFGNLDTDALQFCNLCNLGLFSGSIGCGLVISMHASAKKKGGLTKIYKKQSLLYKSLSIPIVYPSASKGSYIEQIGRLHHKNNYRYLQPCVIRNTEDPDAVDNIAWDTWAEDFPVRTSREADTDTGKKKPIPIAEK